MAHTALVLRRRLRARGLSSHLHLYFYPYASSSDSWLWPNIETTSTTSSSSSSSFSTWSSCPPRRGAGQRHVVKMDHARRSSMATASSESNALASHTQLLAFIKSTFGQLEGRNYFWFNKTNGNWKAFNHDGIYLVLLYRPCENFTSYSELSAAFQRLKYLQQRYPHLNVFAMQCGSSVNSLATQSQVVRTIMKEYITYPILMSDEDFTNMTNGACYLLFEGSMDHVLFLKWDEEPEIMIKEIDGCSVSGSEGSDTVQESKVGWQKHEVTKEPYVGSFKNLFLYYPGCVSVDEDGDRIFISDSNHHRIIVSSGDGKILDYIGSSPGFEDGEFESAKFLRPAASYYHAAEDCLYVVDSENHAIRKADLENRILETVYPVSGQKSSGIWSWIVDKLGLTREIAPKIQEFDANAIAFPWHLLKIAEDDLLITDHKI